MGLRCNTIVECPDDESDEINCNKVLSRETYNSHSPPNTVLNQNGISIMQKVIDCKGHGNYTNHYET